MSSSKITKGILGEAMKTLMKEKPFAKISVGDIVEKCDLNRNSFYYHFKDKYDLVNWIFYVDIVSALNKETITEDSVLFLVEEICNFFYRDKEFYKNAFSVTGQNSFTEYYVELIKELIKTHSEETCLEDEEYQEFYTSFLADAFVAYTTRWLREGAKIPPDKLAQMIKKATIGGT